MPSTRLVARVQRCIDAGAFDGDAVEIAEVLWGSMHGLVMLELVGIDPAGTDAPARFRRALDILFEGLRHHANASPMSDPPMSDQTHV